MKVAAIIAEYNPFHNGHALHIAKTRELCGASHVVAIMSGSFVQRGDTACMDKFTRAKMALQCGVDLVVEMPLPWAMAGAETFARGGVGIAAGLGCVDVLSFGSECGNIDHIVRAAQVLDSESFCAKLRDIMSTGSSYPAALSMAISAIDPDVASVFESPNDTLGAEYCRALSRIAPDITPFCICRVGAGHDSLTAHSDADDDLPVSASFLRRLMSQSKNGKEGIDIIRPHMPPAAYELLRDAFSAGHAPSDISLLDRAMILKLRSMSLNELAGLPDVSEGLEHRIARYAAQINGSNTGFAALCDTIKSKRYTHARLRRILLSAFLGLTADDRAGTPPYIRILGMNNRGKEILSASSLCDGEKLPVLTRYSQLESFSERAKRIFSLEAYAADIYGLTLPSVPSAGSDLTTKLIVL